MLFFLLDTLRDSPARLLAVLPVFLLTVVGSLVFGLTVHEFAHALAAHVQGDDTAKRVGRLSLNPIRHLDPTGTFMILVIGFGWGKPVPVNQNRLSQGPTGMTLVAAAGPLSNLMLAFLLAIPIKLGLLDYTGLGLYRITTVTNGGLLDGLSDLVSLIIFFNLLLAVFNLIPLAPLDGSKVVGGLIPRHQAVAYARLERNGPLILVAIVMLDYALGLGILWGIIGPVVNGLKSAAIG